MLFAFSWYIQNVQIISVFQSLQRQRIENINKKKRQATGLLQPNTDSRPNSGRKNREDSRPLVKTSSKPSTPTFGEYDW